MGMALKNFENLKSFMLDHEGNFVVKFGGQLGAKPI